MTRLLIFPFVLLPTLAFAQDGGAEQAGETLLQYGAIGAMLLLSLIAMGILAKYIAGLYDRILKEKDKQKDDALKALELQTEATKNLEATAAAMRETTSAMKQMVEKFLDARERELEGRR
jgi:methylthioribose-1-phosphate isomerase